MNQNNTNEYKILYHMPGYVPQARPKNSKSLYSSDKYVSSSSYIAQAANPYPSHGAYAPKNLYCDNGGYSSTSRTSISGDCTIGNIQGTCPVGAATSGAFKQQR